MTAAAVEAQDPGPLQKTSAEGFGLGLEGADGAKGVGVAIAPDRQGAHTVGRDGGKQPAHVRAVENLLMIESDLAEPSGPFA